MLRKGIAKEFRGDIWYRIIEAKVSNIDDKYYHRLLKTSYYEYQKDIEKDVSRTFPSHSFFCSESARDAVKRVLLAYSIRNPSVGYCQSMNFIVGILLLHVSEEKAFWILRYLVEDVLEEYFTSSMIGLSLDQMVLESIVMAELPKLYEHINNLNFCLSIFTTRWLMCIFMNTLPVEVSI